MSEDKPSIGLVIRHMYLWRREADTGQEEGLKARPCVIVRVYENTYGEQEVFIAPITHVEPRQGEPSKEIPLATKQRLGLDSERSWIITSEVNGFTWIGPDVRTTPSGAFSYGHLPPRLTRAVIDDLREQAKHKKLALTERDDKELQALLRARKKKDG